MRKGAIGTDGNQKEGQMEGSGCEDRKRGET